MATRAHLKPLSVVSPPASEVAVACVDVTRRYGEGATAVDALRGVSLSISDGKLVAVMGPSGSGKSTLLSMVGGLDRPTTGRGSWLEAPTWPCLGATGLRRSSDVARSASYSSSTICCPR